MRAARPALAVLAVLALSLCRPPPGRAAPPADEGFAGQWETTYGVMTLRARDGGRIVGTYEDGAQGGATIEGRVSGNRLTFTYREAAAEGEGWFELAADGRSFSGQWREKGRVAWQPWTGRRVGPPPAPSFDGVWATQFGRMRLVQDGEKVRGLYANEGLSELEGTVAGGRLRFTYREPAAEGEGWFELADGGEALRGEWRPKGAERWADWTGSRVPRQLGRRWLVVIEARWETSLADEEYSFGAMLKAFFARTPNVAVRHRYFAGQKSLRKWLGEVAFLAEPVTLVIATHGTPEGVTVDDETIGPDSIARSLELARGVELLHFSSCLIMKDRLSRQILRDLGRRGHFSISGYTTSVDWAASAIIEMMYLDMILTRDMSPEEAARALGKLLPFSGDRPVEGAPFDSAGFRIIQPHEIW